MQRVPLFIGRRKPRFAIFFIRTGDSPLFRHLGGVQTSKSRQTRRAGAGALLREGSARKDKRKGLQPGICRHVTSFRYWRSVHMKTFRLLTAVSIAALIAV